MSEREFSQKEKEFIYKYQFQRGLNPMYIPCTKKGFMLTLFILLMTYFDNNGLFFTLLYALCFWWIYRSDFDYKFNEKERIWLFALWNSFLTERRAKPFKSNPILFDNEDIN